MVLSVVFCFLDWHRSLRVMCTTYGATYFENMLTFSNRTLFSSKKGRKRNIFWHSQNLRNIHSVCNAWWLLESFVVCMYGRMFAIVVFFMVVFKVADK